MSKRIIAAMLCMSLAAMTLCGCDAEDEKANKENTQGSDKDAYDEYIHNALEAVKNNSSTPAAPGSAAPTPIVDDQNGRVIYVEKEDSSKIPESVYVSSSVFEDPADNANGQNSDSSSEPEVKEKTPETFEVGTGLVYIDGKYDTAYQGELLQYINDARTGLNYPEMTINTSLNTCANLRAKEIAALLGHMRPDGTMFYSLAPDYYKGEIITTDNATVKETFDAWMTDPISRNMLFSKEYTSIGASNYVCNGQNCIVVSFGY